MSNSLWPRPTTAVSWGSGCACGTIRQEQRDAADGVKLRYQAPPRLQYRDAAGRWHDALADRERAIRDGGREEGIATMALQCLDVFLAPVLEAHALAAVRAAWTEHGPPPQALERVREVGRDPGRWRDLLAHREEDRGKPPTDGDGHANCGPP